MSLGRDVETFGSLCNKHMHGPGVHRSYLACADNFGTVKCRVGYTWSNLFVHSEDFIYSCVHASCVRLYWRKNVTYMHLHTLQAALSCTTSALSCESPKRQSHLPSLYIDACVQVLAV